MCVALRAPNACGPAAAGELELAPTNSTSNIVQTRKHARARRQRRAAARKALCVFVSVVLVVGLMPGFVAWADPKIKSEVLQASDTTVQGVEEVVASEETAVDDADGEVDDSLVHLGVDSITNDAEAPLSNEASKQLSVARVSAPSTDEGAAMTAAAGQTYQVEWKVTSWDKAEVVVNELAGIKLQSGDTINCKIHLDAPSGTYSRSVAYWDGSAYRTYCAQPNLTESGTYVFTCPYNSEYGDVYFKEFQGAMLILSSTKPPVQKVKVRVRPRNGQSTSEYEFDSGTTVTVGTDLAPTPSADEFTFVAWNENANLTGNTHNPGEAIELNANLDLYAMWQKNNPMSVTMGDWEYGQSPSSPVIAAEHNGGNALIEYYTDSNCSTRVADDARDQNGFPKNAGTYWVKATIAGGANYVGFDSSNQFEVFPSGGTDYYAQAEAVSSFTITQKEVGLGWLNTSFDYDGASHIPTVAVSGILPGDDCSVTVSGAQADPGTYTATATALTNSNYKLPANVTRSFTIKKMDINPSVSIENWTYGEGANSPSVTGNSGGGSVTYEYKPSGANDSAYQTTVPTNAGSYIVRATIAETVGYAGATATGDFTINKASLTVKADALSKKYDATDPTLTYTATGLCGSDALTGALTRDEGEGVGTYAIRQGTLTASSNYDLTFTGADFTITAAAPTNVMEPAASGWKYDGATRALVTAGSAAGGEMQYALGSDDATAPTSGWGTSIPSRKDAGNYFVWYKVVGDANHSDTDATPIKVTVAQREATLEWSGTTFTYNGSDQAPTASVGNLVSGDSCTVTVSVTGDHKAKGSYTATATGLSGSNYKLPSSATQAFTINPKPVGITWSGDELTYDGSAQKPTATLTATDIVSGDSCTVTVGGEQTDAGDYTATATLSDDNYELATADASHAFTIAPLAATLSWGTTSFTYTGQEQAPTATVTNLCSQNGVKDTCTVTVSGGRTNAGGPYTATAMALSNPNYKLPVNATTSFSIAKAALTVKAGDNAITYGDAPSGNGVSYSGFVNGEGESVLSGTLAYGYSYTQFGDVGDSYEITPKGLAADNYAITYAKGTLKVEQREVTLVWSAPSEFDYTGSAITWPVPVVKGTVNGDVLTAVWKTATAGADDAYTATAAGTYKPVVDSLTATAPAKASNYKLPDDVAGRTGEWKIKAPGTNNLTVRIEGWTYGKYNATANAPVATADFGTATFAYYKDAECKEPVDSGNPSKVPVDAGNYYVKATVADDPSDNYPGATAVAAFTIAKAKITVTADDKASVRSEDGIDTLTCSISGDLVPADEADLKDNYITLSCAADGKTAGIFSITVTAAEHKNYEITPAPGTYTVTRSLANVTAAGYTGAYDGTDDAAGGKKKAITVTHPADAGITVYYSTESFENIIDAKKMALIQNADSIDDAGFSEAWTELTKKLAALETEQKCSKDNPSYSRAGDHEVFFIIVTEQSKADMIVGSKTVTITKPQLAVTAGDKTITYGDEPANDGVTYSGWVNSEDESVLDASNLSYSYGGYAAGKPVGSYVITPSGIAAANYELVYKPGTLTVDKREIELEWPDPSELAYNGKQQTYGPPTVKNPHGTDDVKAVCASGTDKAKDAGSYVAMVESLSGAAAGNYELPSDADKLRHAWKIKPAKLTVTASDSVITYGDAPAGNGVTYDKLLGDDTESSLTGTLTYAYTYRQYGGVGEYALTPSGLSSQNYDIDFKAGKLTVKSRVVTLAWPTSDSFDYTGAELTYGKPALGGVVNGDDVSVGDYAGNKATTAGTHTAEVTSLAGAKSGNYALPANKSHDWTIVGAANRATVTLEGWTYGDGPNEPAVEAAFGEDTAEFTYAASEDGPFGAAVPTAAGTYWVKATIAASGNHDGAEATAKFTIARRPATVTAKPQVVEVGGSVATGLDQVELTGAASGDVLSAIVLAGSSTASVTEAGTVTPSGAVLKDASGADMTANYDVTYKPGALLVAGVKAAENGKVVYALHKDIWMTVDEAGRIIDLGQAGRDEQLIDMADGHALLLATAEELGVIVKEDGGFTAKVGTYELVLKANPEVGVTAHVVSVAATDPATGITVYANDTTPDADVLRRAKAGDADAIAALIELAGAVAFDRDGNQVAVTGIDLSAVDPDKPATYKATYSTAGGASATANLTVKEGGSGSGDGSGGGSSATKPGSTRKAASPATGDAMPVALLAATALASACALAFSWRRRESALPGKHARK